MFTVICLPVRGGQVHVLIEVHTVAPPPPHPLSQPLGALSHPSPPSLPSSHLSSSGIIFVTKYFVMCLTGNKGLVWCIFNGEEFF